MLANGTSIAHMLCLIMFYQNQILKCFSRKPCWNGRYGFKPSKHCHPCCSIAVKTTKLFNHNVSKSGYMLTHTCLSFFCTYPRCNTVQRALQYGTYPSIHFNSLYSGPKSRINHIKIEKLKCLMHYVNRVIANPLTGNITFQRQCITDLPAWDKCDNITFTKVCYR